jgi:hypothetical protein
MLEVRERDAFVRDRKHCHAHHALIHSESDRGAEAPMTEALPLRDKLIATYPPDKNEPGPWLPHVLAVLSGPHVA